MKKYVFESLKFFCAAILCTILSAFATPARAALPSGYTQLEYINMQTGSYLQTDIVPTYDGRIEMDFQTTTMPAVGGSFMGGRSGSYPSGLTFGFNASKSFIFDGFSTNRYESTNLLTNNTRYKYTWNNQVAKLETGGSVVGTNTFTGTGTTTHPLFINGANNAGSVIGNVAGIYLYSFKVWNGQGTLIANFIPAKNASGVVGMYDTVSGQFFTNAGTGTFTGGDPVAQTPTNSGPISSVTVAGLVEQNGTPSPATPVAINTNNGVLKASKNLFSGEWEQGSMNAIDGSDSVSAAWIKTKTFIPVQSNTSYVFDAVLPSEYLTGIFYMFCFDNSGTFSSKQGPISVPSSVITDPNCSKIRLQVAYSDRSNLTPSDLVFAQLERGTTATAYHPYGEVYVEGTAETITDSANPAHTATVATLLGVGDYRDTQNINTGAITRKVGVKVLDGTEDWAQRVGNIFETGVSPEALSPVGTGSLSNQYTFFSGAWADIPNNGFRIAGTQLRIRNDTTTSTEQLKQYLAEQYANGTPVIIVYPLATPTTESVAGQTMTTAPVNNRTGGVSGMTITTLLSSGASVVTTIATNAIKIATTKYNETKFSPLNTALANAISVVDTVVSNTITQAASIATLQAQKQTRPADDTCPAYKQCLLVEDENGKPHWYEITDPFRDFVAPIIANNVAPASTTNQPGYTQLEYIESTGTQWIDTGVRVELGKVEIKYTMLPTDGDWATIIGKHGDNIIFRRKTATSDYEIYMYSSLPYTWLGGYVENQTRTLQVSRSGNNIIIYSNGQLVFEGQNDKKEGGEDNTSIYLFSSVLSGKSVYPSKSRLYYAKFYTKDGTLVRNFVPVRNNATGKYGLYDTVGKQFYGNAASSGDDFTAGPEVLNQNPDVPGMTWTATWTANATTGVNAGTITGEGLCNGVTGTESTAATSTQTSSANWSVDGANCWCKTTAIDDGDDTTIVDGVWVFYYARSSAADCALNCAYACAARVRDNASFRSALFGM